jgi:DNA helicase-2/ATP-dependent DNA helicase PcrA
MEEGIFPHQRSMDDAEEMAEERRLCYVGMTRAKDRLYLLHAFRRTLYGESGASIPSRFLADIPQQLIQGRYKPAEQRQATVNRVTRWERSTPNAPRAPQFRTGQRVSHARFGEGTVLETRMAGDDEEVTVIFENLGVKRLAASMANLQALDGGR